MRTTEIERFLPGVFQRTVAPRNPLGVLIAVMSALHAPSDEVLSHLDAYIDPRRTPDPFVPYLTGWVDLAWLLLDPPDDPYSTVVRAFPPGLGHLRELIASAAYHSEGRGTAQGLRSFLTVATGISGFRVEEEVLGPDGRPLPYHFRLHAPEAARPFIDLIVRIVAHEKPAHVTFDAEEIVFEH